MAARTMKYESVADRFVTERDPREMLKILIRLIELDRPGWFEKGVNEHFPQATGEPYSAEYAKPQ